MEATRPAVDQPQAVHREGTGMLDRHGWAARQTDVLPAERWVLFALAAHAAPSGLCWPKVTTLADEVGQHPDTVGRHLSALGAAGLVERVRVRRGGQLRGWLFRVLVPGSCPVDPGDVPRWAGDVEVPDAWRLPVDVHHPTPPSDGHPTPPSGQEPTRVRTSQEQPTQPNPETPRAPHGAGGCPDDVVEVVEVDTVDPSAIDQHPDPWQDGRRLWWAGVARSDAVEVIRDRYGHHTGEAAGAWAGWDAAQREVHR